MRLPGNLLLALAIVTVLAPAPASGAPTRLFISGHSLTDQPMPGYLARIAESQGTPLDWNRQYMVGSAIKHRTRGRGNETGWAGYRMGDNREGSGMDVVAELRHQPYDLLLITEQHGLIDSLVWHDTLRHLRHYHDRFIDGNARGRTWFYEPWLGIPGKREVQRWIAYERAASPRWQCIVTRLNQSLAAEGRGDRLASLPAGWALAELIDRATNGGGLEGITAASVAETVDRLFQDSVHLRPLGAYYIALVSYAAMFERSPVGAWAPEDVSPAAAASLQRVAGEAIARHRVEGRALAPEACRKALQGDFIDVYMAHMRDDYWAQQAGNRLVLAWRRFKQNLKTRWFLWRHDPLAWDRVADRSYWFAAP